MSSRNPLGGTVTSRLASRLDRQGLTRMAMPGGGEVFRGPLASRALKSMGARAMTVDRSIIVGDDFSPGKAEDQALFAHEQYHVDHSGGEGGHNGRDAEEIGARATEAMVFHRAAAMGGYEGGYEDRAGPMQGEGAWNAKDQNSDHATSGTQGSSDTPESVDSSPNPGRGYQSLRAQGYSHMDVCEELGRRVIAALDESATANLDRGGDKKGWL